MIATLHSSLGNRAGPCLRFLKSREYFALTAYLLNGCMWHMAAVLKDAEMKLNS